MSPDPQKKQKQALIAMLAFAPAFAVAGEETGAYQTGLTYTGDLLKNTRGGVTRDSAYVDLLSLYGDIDTAKAWGHKGGTLHVDYLVSRKTFSAETGDAQVASNIDFGDGERLYELWYEQQLGDSGSSIKAGLYDVNSEFDSIETAGLFLNSSQGAGMDFAQSGTSGPSIAPVTGMAVRGLWAVSPAWKVQAVVADGVPGDHNGNNRHTHVQLRKDEGALVVGEINYQPQEDLRFGLGSWYYTHGLVSYGGGNEHSNGAYGFVDAGLGEAAGGKWASYARLGAANVKVNQFGHYYGTGVTYTANLWHQDDKIGLGIASAHNGDDYLHSEKLAGNQWDKAETALELTYATQVTPWLSLQPDVQYIINPGTNPALDSALMIGLRMQVTLGVADLQHAMNR